MTFLFVSTECPIANRCLPELIALETAFKAHHIPFVHVYPNADETPERIRRHREEFGLSPVAYRDPDHSLATRLGACRTPEAIVLAADGRRIYQGRINDQFSTIGVGRPAPTRHDLADALQAFVDGSSRTEVVEPAVGCAFRSTP